MTILKFKGVVEMWDSNLKSENNYSIGGVDFIAKIQSTAFNGPVTIAIADDRFTGDLYCSEGLKGYSEYTPSEPADLDVGAHNILKILGRYDGQEITLWIADEPINTLE